MTATAFAIDPALDRFDDVDVPAPKRPELRLVEGGPYCRVAPSADALAEVEALRRRRFLVLVAVTALVLAIAWAAGVSVLSFGASATAVDEVPAVHVVTPGDSYGAIAADLGMANPLEAGEALRVANGGGELVVGQRLVVDLGAINTASVG